MKNKIKLFAIILFFIFLITNCEKKEDKMNSEFNNLHIKANMLFLYYSDINKAFDFYNTVLGLECVLDYGFARAYQISKSSLVCLVDETKGMHKTTEPKTVTLSFITQEVDAWYEYLLSKGVKMHSPLKGSSENPIRGFVALDCEGYFLEFETFKEHPENENLLPILSSNAAIYPAGNRENTRPKELGIQGTVYWLYYKDVAAAREFYENYLGLELLVDQAFSQVYTSSETGFIGLVDEIRGLHHFSEKKSVNVGFITDEIESWYKHLVDKEVKIKDPLEDSVEGLVKAFVAYDPAGYYLEFDTFPERDQNERLLKMLEGLD